MVWRQLTKELWLSILPTQRSQKKRVSQPGDARSEATPFFAHWLGGLEPGNFMTFPSYWECATLALECLQHPPAKSPIPTAGYHRYRMSSSQLRGRSTTVNHQPAEVMHKYRLLSKKGASSGGKAPLILGESDGEATRKMRVLADLTKYWGNLKESIHQEDENGKPPCKEI